MEREDIVIPEEHRGDPVAEELYRDQELARLAREGGQQGEGEGQEGAQGGQEGQEGQEGQSLPQFNWGAFGEGVDSFEAATERVGSLQTEIKSRDEQIKALSESNIDDPALFRLNHLKKNDPDNFGLYAKVLMGGDLDHLDLIRHKELRDNPEFSKDPELLEAYLEDKYGLVIPVPPKPDPDDTEAMAEWETKQAEASKKQKINRMKLAADANAFKKELMGKAEEIEIPERLSPEQLSERQQQQQKELKTKWGGFAEKALDSFTQFPVTVTNAEGKQEVFAHIDVPADFKEKAKEGLLNALIGANPEDSKDAVRLTMQNLVSSFILSNQVSINSAILAKAREMSEEELSKYHTNIDLLKDAEGGEIRTEGQRKLEENRKAVEKFVLDQ